MILCLTNGAVFSGPALVTVAFAVLAGTVLSAACVTSFQIAYRTSPALVTATASSYTHTASTTVHCTHLCKHKQRWKKLKSLFGLECSIAKDFKRSCVLQLKTTRAEVTFLWTVMSKLLTLSVKNVWQEIDNCRLQLCQAACVAEESLFADTP